MQFDLYHPRLIGMKRQSNPLRPETGKGYFAPAHAIEANIRLERKAIIICTLYSADLQMHGSLMPRPALHSRYKLQPGVGASQVMATPDHAHD